jgi:hypothetical protein
MAGLFPDKAATFTVQSHNDPCLATIQRMRDPLTSSYPLISACLEFRPGDDGRLLLIPVRARISWLHISSSTMRTCNKVAEILAASSARRAHKSASCPRYCRHHLQLRFLAGLLFVDQMPEHAYPRG